jgi:hypothetical protein
MDESPAAIWFVGDLNDAWVASIADALPVAHGVVRIQSAGEPVGAPHIAEDHPPRLIVVHRQTLAPLDAQWLQEMRAAGASTTSPALILCVGPYVRYEELERYSGLVDLVLSEATAADVISRHAARLLEGRARGVPRPESNPGARVLVASANAEMCRTIAEACSAAGYPAETAHDEEIGNRLTSREPQSRSGETLLTVWDVPVLEEWSERLDRHARQAGPVIALLGFPDRNMVAVAKSKGAIACLELPLNLDDLVDLIERFANSMSHGPRPAPPRAEPPHALPPRPRRQLADQRASTNPAEWPVPSRKPRIVK